MLAGANDRKANGAPSRAAVFVAGHGSGRLSASRENDGGPGETGWVTATHRVMEAGESETGRSPGRRGGLTPGDSAGRSAKALDRSRKRCASLPPGAGARRLMEVDRLGRGSGSSLIPTVQTRLPNAGPSDRGW